MSSSILFVRFLNKISIIRNFHKEPLQRQVKRINFLGKLLLKQIQTSSVLNGVISEQQKIDVFGLKINIEKVGTGSHHILCLPGVLGSIETDFTPQLQKLDRDKFTIIVWDPPGFGKSRPPKRDMVNSLRQVLINDARYAHELMKKLGYKKYSLLGWSSGGITAILMTSFYPKSVQKIIIFGAQSFVCAKLAVKSIELQNIDSWSEQMKKPMIDIYGDEYSRLICSNWFGGFIKMYQEGRTDLCKEELSSVKCPTFIIHGAKDYLVGLEHAEYIHQHITNSKLFVMPEGKHNLHLRYADEFNTLAEEFLLDDKGEK